MLIIPLMLLLAQGCDGMAATADVVGGIACPDGAAATVISTDSPTPESPATETSAAPVNATGPATLTAPAEVASGSKFFVNWTGPDNQSDSITVAKPATPGNSYENFTYTRKGSPLHVTAPDEPGDYELRYVQGQSRTILATQPLRVLAAPAKLTAASEVGSGSIFEVQWSGPDNQSDSITVAKPSTPGNSYENFTYTRKGSPLNVTAPDEPGDYELRYVQGQSGTVLATQPIRVLAAPATLTAASEVGSGSVFEVQWSGPDNQSDSITVAKPSTPGNSYENFTYTRKGSPLNVTAPDEPGDYELRYVQGQSGTVLATQPIRVLAASAKLTAASEVGSGNIFEVQWSGPDNQSDSITVAKPSTPGNSYENFTYTRKGSPLNVTAPDEPGDYELRYVQGQSGTVLATQPIRVLAASATLTAASEVGSGTIFEVQWSGPDNQSDSITVAKPSTPSNSYENFTYTRKGSPLNVTAPDEPGDYELRYVQGQSRTILATQPIRVLPTN